MNQGDYNLNLGVNLNHDVSYQNHRFINLNIHCLHNLTLTKGVISAKHGNLSPEPSRFFI